MPLAWKISAAGFMLALGVASPAFADDDDIGIPDAHQFSNPLFGPATPSGGGGDDDDVRGGFIGSGRTSAGRASSGEATSTNLGGGTGASSEASASQLPVDDNGYLMAPALFRKASEMFRQMVPSVKVGNAVMTGRPMAASPLFAGSPLAALNPVRAPEMAPMETGSLRGPAAIDDLPTIGARLEADPRTSRLMSELKSSDEVVTARQETQRREQQMRQAVSRGMVKGAAVGAFRLMESVKK